MVGHAVVSVGTHNTVCAGAELANVLNEGALEAVRRGADLITRADVYNGIDRVLQVQLHLHDPVPPRELLFASEPTLATSDQLL